MFRKFFRKSFRKFFRKFFSNFFRKKINSREVSESFPTSPSDASILNWGAWVSCNGRCSSQFGQHGFRHHFPRHGFPFCGAFGAFFGAWVAIGFLLPFLGRGGAFFDGGDFFGRPGRSVSTCWWITGFFPDGLFPKRLIGGFFGPLEWVFDSDWLIFQEPGTKNSADKHVRDWRQIRGTGSRNSSVRPCLYPPNSVGYFRSHVSENLKF